MTLFADLYFYFQVNAFIWLLKNCSNLTSNSNSNSKSATFPPNIVVNSFMVAENRNAQGHVLFCESLNLVLILHRTSTLGHCSIQIVASDFVSLC